MKLNYALGLERDEVNRTQPNEGNERENEEFLEDEGDDGEGCMFDLPETPPEDED